MSDGLLLNKSKAITYQTDAGSKSAKLIKDIRLLESDVPNIDGNATP